MSQFVDLISINIQSGDGGNGIVAWRREKYVDMGGPAGGNGGKGGDVIVEATSDLNTLIDFRFKKEFKAQPGERGGPKNRQGKRGEDLVLKVPVGTLIREKDTGDIIADLRENGQRVLVAEGGRGGRGNADMVTRSNRAPYHCEPGEQGIERELELELKLLADVGIVGLPNAGKSTLLSAMTAARPKIADYPFSTLQPNLGVVRNPNGDGFVMADVPGLVEGASQGIGLGHQFLRHLERTRLLVHMVDASDENFEQHIAVIGNELELYSERLSKLPQILCLNKCDVIGVEAAEELAEKTWDRIGELLPPNQQVLTVLPIGAATRYGVDDLQNILMQELANLEPEEEVHHVVEDTRARQHPDEGFEIQRKKNKFYIYGNRIERLVTVTNMRSPEALHHLYNVMRAMGIIDALIQSDIQPGQEIHVAGIVMTFGEEMA
jgi:GTP-binding protein